MFGSSSQHEPVIGRPGTPIPTPTTLPVNMDALLQRFADMEYELARVRDENRELHEQIQQLPVTPRTPPSSFSSKAAKLDSPPAFDGDHYKTETFIYDVTMRFEATPDFYPNAQHRVLTVISWCKGMTRDWLRKWFQQNPTADWEDVQNQLRLFFPEPATSRADYAAKKLSELKQTGSAAKYASVFMEHRVDSDASDAALWRMFKTGLKDELRKLLTVKPAHETNTFGKYIAAAISLDYELYQVNKTTSATTTTTTTNKKGKQSAKSNSTPPVTSAVVTTSSNSAVPMEIDASKIRHAPLTDEEKSRRRKEGLCLRCGQAGHFATDCPLGKKAGNGKG